MPDPKKLLATIRKATELSRATSGRKGAVIEVSGADDLMVVGDLHGNLPAFREALAVAALDRRPKRHVVLQDLVHEVKNDDDERPDRSHRLVDLVSALKCRYPERVHLILGNHELSELTGRKICKNGQALNARFRRGIDLSYGASAESVYQAYRKLFAALPLAVRTPNRVFICHTLPGAVALDQLDLTLLRAEQWPEESMERGGTIYALTWGRDSTPETADRFAAMVDADLFVTGHQPCDIGFRRANHRQIIVDGTNPYPAYCLVPTQTPISIKSLLQSTYILNVLDLS
jgi:hypothetical protein